MDETPTSLLSRSQGRTAIEYQCTPTVCVLVGGHHVRPVYEVLVRYLKGSKTILNPLRKSTLYFKLPTDSYRFTSLV